MTRTEGAEQSKKGTSWSLAYFLAAAVGFVAILAMATAPVAALLGDSRYAIPATLHGAAAILYVIAATVAAYLGYRLFIGRLHALVDLRILAGLSAFFSLVTILFGNWIYIYYRATEGPRTYFLENSPEVHQVFFEFKEFIALFTLPLASAAAFVLWRERDSILAQRGLRRAVAAFLGLSWAYLMLAFGLGAAITKLRAV